MSLTLADALSLVRIPLGVLFLFVAHRPLVALGVAVLAGISDVLDGWAARRYRKPGDDDRHRGDWLDPLCDKIFVTAMLGGIIVHHDPPPMLIALSLTRETLQMVSMVVYRLVPPLRRMRYDYRAHPVGKATTVAQFLTASALLLRSPAAVPLAWLSALLGALAVGIYLGRARRIARDA